MAIGVGGYSKIWSPFAMSMCWGLLMATCLTLLLVPAFYHVVEDGRVWLRGRLSRSATRDPRRQAEAEARTPEC